MKKMFYLLPAIVMSGCFATDLSDLDSLYINTKDGVVAPAPPAQTATNQSTTNTSIDDSESCDLLFCGNLSSLQDVLSEGDRVAFGVNMAQIEGFYVPNNSEVWKRWTNEQYGIYENVEIVRYIYDKKVNNKTLVIETFYNYNRGEFLFGRVLYQGDYENMMNFLMKIYYPNARPDFNPEVKFADNPNSKYFTNADTLLKTLTNYIESL